MPDNEHTYSNPKPDHESAAESAAESNNGIRNERRHSGNSGNNQRNSGSRWRNRGKSTDSGNRTDSGNASGRASGERTDRGNPAAGTAEEEARNVGAESVEVEQNTRQRKPRSDKGKPRGRRKKTETFTPEFVEKTVTLGFDLAAMIRGPHWKVADPEKELKPWSKDAAELLNKIPPQYAESAMQGYAATAVLSGIGMMVFQRAMVDMQLKQKQGDNPPPPPREFKRPTRQRPTNTQAEESTQDSGEGTAAPTPANVMGIGGDEMASG